MQHHLIPIQITLQAANAADIRQLVQDLAGTLAVMPAADIPTRTEVSTVDNPAPAPTTAPVAPNMPATNAGQLTAQVPTAPVSQSAPTTPATPPAAAVPATPVAPTAAPTYDFNQLATATMQLQQAGQNIFELFGQFGIQALNQLPKERYGEYANALRERGAKI